MYQIECPRCGAMNYPMDFKYVYTDPGLFVCFAQSALNGEKVLHDCHKCGHVYLSVSSGFTLVSPGSEPDNTAIVVPLQKGPRFLFYAGEMISIVRQRFLLLWPIRLVLRRMRP